MTSNSDKPLALTPEQATAKHDYSLHQDNLLWSRTQTLIAVQGSALAGGYTIATHKGLACALIAVVGIAVTALLWILMERDRAHADKGLKESGVPETKLDDGTWWQGKWWSGRFIIRYVNLLLIFADVVLMLWIAFQTPS